MKQWSPDVFRSLGKGRGENCEGVSGMVHELWAGGGHLGVYGAGGCLGLSSGRVTLALADGGACLGRDRNGSGDFMDQEIHR